VAAALDILTAAGGKTEDEQQELVRRTFPDNTSSSARVLTLLHDLRSVSMRIPEPALAAVRVGGTGDANADDSTAQTTSASPSCPARCAAATR
jgi:hypothetical protein